MTFKEEDPVLGTGNAAQIYLFRGQQQKELRPIHQGHKTTQSVRLT